MNKSQSIPTDFAKLSKEIIPLSALKARQQDKRIRVKVGGRSSQVTWSHRVRACPEDREDREGKRKIVEK